MTPASFEAICRASRLKPYPKKFVKDHALYYAEGYRQADENYPEPHYKVLWAVDAGEKMDVAQEIFIPAVSEINLRMDMAKDAALKFLDLSHEVRRFENN